MTAGELGRKGGRSRSPAKRAAARRNGSKGGRPRFADLLARRVREARAQLQPLLPDMDPGDLDLILSCLLRPLERRQFFMWRDARGRLVF